MEQNSNFEIQIFFLLKGEGAPPSGDGQYCEWQCFDFFFSLCSSFVGELTINLSSGSFLFLFDCCLSFFCSLPSSRWYCCKVAVADDGGGAPKNGYQIDRLPEQSSPKLRFAVFDLLHFTCCCVSASNATLILTLRSSEESSIWRVSICLCVCLCVCLPCLIGIISPYDLPEPISVFSPLQFAR